MAVFIWRVGLKIIVFKLNREINKETIFSGNLIYFAIVALLNLLIKVGGINLGEKEFLSIKIRGGGDYTFVNDR